MRSPQWTKDELAIIDRMYPMGGGRACLGLLPRRTKHAIRCKAWDRRLRSPFPNGWTQK